jgi:hypothetical protein
MRESMLKFGCRLWDIKCGCHKKKYLLNFLQPCVISNCSITDVFRTRILAKRACRRWQHPITFAPDM